MLKFCYLITIDLEFALYAVYETEGIHRSEVCFHIVPMISCDLLSFCLIGTHIKIWVS
jgi:hypothetical protein